MKKMMSLLMVAIVALTISLELSTAARVPVGPNDVAHQSTPIIAASRNAVINPQVLPVLEAAPKDVLNPQDVNRAIPSGPRPQSVREVIIPQRMESPDCICCVRYYNKYCNKLCCE